MVRSLLPILQWGPRYRPGDLRSDIAAGLTVGAMLVPQGMAYAKLAGLPPEVGLYASTLPVLVYALFGTSRQLAVGPVAIVSLLTASALAPLADGDAARYLSLAAALAFLVGVIHLVLGVGRLGFLVNLLSHSVLVGFTAAAAIIIGFSQVKSLLGITVERHEYFYETVLEVASHVGETHLLTLGFSVVSIALLVGLKRLAPKVPGALVLVLGSIAVVRAFGLGDEGLALVGDIPSSLPGLSMPDLGGSVVGDLFVTALIITLVGFMESIAVAKVYARQNRYEVDSNQELVALGAANVASGVFGGYPVTGGFSRTAVNATAGSRTPLASIITAAIVVGAIVLLTPLFVYLPNAALAAIIVVAVSGLIDVEEMRHIAAVKKTDVISMAVAFLATLALGVELGIGVAVVASLAVVFVRMSTPHVAHLGRVPGTRVFRNEERFPEVEHCDGVSIVRIDAAVSFANASFVKRLLLDEGADHRAVVVDASGINDLDATGAEMISEVLEEFDDLGVELHLAEPKGPVRDVLWNAGLWKEFARRMHVSVHDALEVLEAERAPVTGEERRAVGLDERVGGPTG